MRVLHMLSSTGFYGAENMAAELIRGLAARGVENFVWSLRSGEGSNTDIVGTVRDFARDAAVVECRGKWDWRLPFALRNYVREHGIDVVHSHKYKTNFYAAIACRGMPCVLVSTCHNWLLDGAKLRLYAALDKIVLKAFDRVVGVSDEVLAELRKRLDRERTMKIDNCVNVERFDASMPKDAAKAALGLGHGPLVGFVGRLTPDKGVSNLLEAARSLRKQGTFIDILVIGDGEHQEELQREASSLGLGGNVHFLGRRDDMPRLYAAMDVFVLPSLREGFPMVVLEAMASGVAVIATRVGDIPYLVQEGGILVDPGGVPDLAAAMLRLVSDESEARRLGHAGRERVRRNFTSSIMAQRYQDLYEETLAQRRGSR